MAQHTAVVLGLPIATLRRRIDASVNLIAAAAGETDATFAIADALVCAPGGPVIDEDLLARCPRLRTIASLGSGCEHIDLAACERRGVVVTTTPDAVTEATADLAFALLLALTRRVVAADRAVRAGRFWVPLGRDLHGTTLGIVGLGRIGRSVARRAEAFGLSVVYTGPRAHEDRYPCCSLAELLARSDHVTLHCPSTPATHHLIGDAELASMRPQATLINTSRGAIVDEEALVRWVARGGRAGLDVFEHEPRVHPELLNHDNVVLTPHIGSATVGTRARMYSELAENLVSALAGRGPTRVVVPPTDG